MTKRNEDDPKLDAGGDAGDVSENPSGSDDGDSLPGNTSPDDVSPVDEEGEIDRRSAASRPRPARIGWLSLLVALLAAAGAGTVWIEQRAGRNLGEQIADVRADLAARGAMLERLAGEVESMTGDTRRLTDELGALKTQVDGRLEELPARITRLEQTVDRIPGMASDVRNAWLRAEAEYFLRVANAQLELAGNIEVSIKALEMADEKLKVIGDPRLTRVRAQLSDERAALNAIPRPDAEGIVLTLGSLARSLESLPLAQRAPGQYGNRRSEDMTETGFERAWRTIVDALLSIISVKRDDQSVTPLMSEADESMLIRSLDLELQIARLAVIRNEALLYRRSLEAVTDRLERYFDPDAPVVIAALATVSELMDVQLPDALPDVSGSLAMLMRIGDEAVVQ